MSTKTSTRPLTFNKLGYLILYVRDTEKALPFYRDTLGMTVQSEAKGWVELKLEGVTIALHSSDKVLADHPSEAAPWVVFQTEDVHAAYEGLKARGVKFIKPMKGNDSNELHLVCEMGDGMVGMGAEFHDVDGNNLSIFGVVKK